jgi:threonine dehydratase
MAADGLSPQLAVSIADIKEAAARIAGQAVRTPLLECAELNDYLGGRILLKAENLQVGGAFKFRGAYNRLAALTQTERARGVVAASTGNHAQGIGHAAKRLGIKACIVMPQDAPQVKLDNTRALGCEVITFDRAKEDRDTLARRIAAERGCVFVHPYDDPWVMAGQGTIGLELLAQASVQLDDVLICCGGGGLTAGITTALKAQRPEINIYAVEPQAYDDTVRSLATGQRLGIEKGAKSICDAISTLMPGELTFPVLQHYGVQGVVVSDEEVRRAVRYAFTTLRLVVEPGGAVALAAVLAGKLPVQGRAVAVILSGGNVDTDLYNDIINGK